IPKAGKTSLSSMCYAAPERIDEKTVSPASDIFSMGVIFYEMLTAKHPSSGPPGVFEPTICTPLSVYEVRPEVSTSLSQVVDKAMALRPEDRFATVEDVQEALAAVELETPDSGREKE